jgi:hypothetical protein
LGVEEVLVNSLVLQYAMLGCRDFVDAKTRSVSVCYRGIALRFVLLLLEY